MSKYQKLIQISDVIDDGMVETCTVQEIEKRAKKEKKAPKNNERLQNSATTAAELKPEPGPFNGFETPTNTENEINSDPFLYYTYRNTGPPRHIQARPGAVNGFETSNSFCKMNLIRAFFVLSKQVPTLGSISRLVSLSTTVAKKCRPHT